MVGHPIVGFWSCVCHLEHCGSWQLLAAAAQTWYAQHRLYWTPRPLGTDAPETAFSEGRAMAHTFHLASTIGDRQARFSASRPNP